MIHTLKTISHIVLAATLITMIVTLAGCGGKEVIGEGIPSSQPKVKLADVTASPSKYHEKTFVVNGTVSSQCSALCDFVLSDGANSVTIYAQDFKFPKLALGTPVSVYVEATAGDRLVLSALGMQI